MIKLQSNPAIGVQNSIATLEISRYTLQVE